MKRKTIFNFFVVAFLLEVSAFGAIKTVSAKNSSLTSATLWKNTNKRRDEFLSKTPQERREMRRQVKNSVKSNLKITPRAVKKNQPSNEVAKLWNSFWNLFKKPTPTSHPLQP